MKKVWILEKFEPAENTLNEIDKLKEMRKSLVNKNDKEGLEVCEKMISILDENLKKNPDGHWFGFEGKSNYKDFCYCAKAAIRRNPNGIFRVVKAEIPDDAKYWNGYKNAVINEGVYRYLMATKNM